MWKCPECHEEIEYLDFRATTRGYESGSATLTSEYTESRYDRISEHDYSDGGTDETYDYEYTCHECEHAVSLESLEWENDHDDEEETTIPYTHTKCYTCFKYRRECIHFVTTCKHCQNKPKDPEMEEEKHKIISPSHNILAVPKYKYGVTDDGMVCQNKKCNYVFVFTPASPTSEEEFFECPKCGTTNSKFKYLKTLEPKT